MIKQIMSWYKWFSFLALAALLWDTSRRIKLSAPSFWDRFDLWNRAVFNIWKIFIIYIIIPIIVFSVLVGYIFGDVAEYSVLSQAVGILIVVFVYLVGVYATHRHILWRERNIPHLLNRPHSSAGDDEKENNNPTLHK